MARPRPLFAPVTAAMRASGMRQGVTWVGWLPGELAGVVWMCICLCVCWLCDEAAERRDEGSRHFGV